MQEQNSSMGRRDVLKKSAVVVGAAWTAPMIVSSKVGASSGGTCSDGVCTYSYLVKIDAGGGCEDSFPNNNGFGAGTELDCDAQFRSLLSSSGISTVRSGGCSNVVTILQNTSSILKIKLPPGFRVTFALRKQGQGCVGQCSSGDPVCDSTGSPTFTFSCGEYSNMILVVCGPDMYGSPINAYTAITASDSAETPMLADESSRSVMTEEAPMDATTTSEATTTTSEATTTTSEVPATTEATTTTSEVPASTEATTTTSVATPEP